ncbi:MAG: glycosyltransferase family 2 protein [Candidatus Omnitrophica bacterium]|nr:glycosyltransferase family 2 protein [Candidatus Omnitrophota bacterium]MDD5352459.1 glycosyltransferase family 2 protein [Candidatus Omnitrophota bacterium]MDD5550057.1 glycosyltransferase family 2 protein [Candidatus Omnitrophota bacterium]
MSERVSINIPTYNSGKTLEETLVSIANQTYKNIEVIIIDSFSKDRTIEIAKKYGANIFTADSLALARKVGVENSSGKYIFLVDSDQTLDNDTVERCVAVCEERGFDVVTLFEKSRITKNTLAERIIAYDKWLFHSLHDDDPIHGTAIPRFFKAEYMKRIDFLNNPPITFEHSMIHNEIVKMGAKVKFIDSHIYHYETPTFRDVFKKFKRYGYYYVPALKKDANLVFHHSLPRRAYFSPKAFKNPLLLMGLFYLYFVKGIATFAGILSYFKDKIIRKP